MNCKGEHQHPRGEAALRGGERQRVPGWCMNCKGEHQHPRGEAALRDVEQQRVPGWCMNWNELAKDELGHPREEAEGITM